MLIMVCGLPGTGKTTISKALSQTIGATLLRTDVIRKEMLSENTYTEKERDSVYGNMFVVADEKLRNGEDCILDGTFYKKSLRDEAKGVADKNKSEFHIVECVLHENAVKSRINARKGDESEADFKVYKFVKKTFEPITENHITIDTSKDTKECMDKIMKEIKR
ncbi:MAG: AAA family ATPase [Candidatus Aenigmarchaeota archaeon]|nr:AAA family ATPase [Candidatus Aenigmarchaeota archaeon]